MIRRFAIYTAIGLSSALAQANVLFIDLNDVGPEIPACRRGLQRANERNGANSDIYVVGPGDPSSMRGPKVTYEDIDRKIKELERQGVRIDSVILSGEDGTAEFFGSHGNLRASEFRRLLTTNPRTMSNVKVTALWGCYPTAKYGCDNTWLRPIRSINVAVGFAVQGRNKYHPDNHAHMENFCESQTELAQASRLNELCELFSRFRHIPGSSLSMCNMEGVVSDMYRPREPSRAQRFSRDWWQEACQTHEELQERCSEYEVDGDLSRTYQSCLDATNPNYSRECVDTSDRRAKIRLYYNQIHLWRHCADELQRRYNYQYPTPARVLRLLKYPTIAKNLARLNQRELSEYDQMVTRAGRPDLALGDIGRASRPEVKAKIQEALTYFRARAQGRQAPINPIVSQAAPPPPPRPASRRSSAGAGFLFGDEDSAEAAPQPQAAPARPQAPPATSANLNGVDPGALAQMANGINRTVVTMEYDCSDVSSVNDGWGTKSRCIISYQQAQGQARR